MNSRKKLIVANWKMQGSIALTQDICRALLQAVTQEFSQFSKTDIAICPPAIYLPMVQECLTGSCIHWGGQNINQNAPGAYTGEISAEMLVEFGARYVILGHSERRQYFQETDEIIAKKFMRAQQLKLIPILCIGESALERKNNQTEQVLQTQLEKILQKNELQDFVIAYEPIWAIGTGVSATPEMAQEAHAFIRELLFKRDKVLAAKAVILYGGSVKPNNAAGLFAMPDIDGGLIGGASLQLEDFLNIQLVASFAMRGASL